MFDHKLLRQPTVGTLLFIHKTENIDKPVIFNDNGNVTVISSEFEHNQLTRWKSGKNWVFIWAERIHDKKINEAGEKRYYNHFLYRYFLVPAGRKINVLESKNQFDFGFHRVKDSLLAEKAVLLLTVTSEDMTGHSLTQ